jgi:hypothetical protein
VSDFDQTLSYNLLGRGALGLSATALVGLLVVLWFLDGVGKSLLEQELYLLIQ